MLLAIAFGSYSICNDYTKKGKQTKYTHLGSQLFENNDGNNLRPY